MRWLLLAAAVLLGTRAEAQHYQQTNLVSDEPGLAVNTDGNLVNPWGLTRSATSTARTTSSSRRTTPARFIFVTQDGTISGWHPAVDATNAVIKSFEPTAVYTGVTIASNDGRPFLYVANFSEQRIDVDDTSFEQVPHKRHLFNDERFRAKGYSPFNVANIGGNLYVKFAKLDPATNDEVELGFVSFD